MEWDLLERHRHSQNTSKPKKNGAYGDQLNSVDSTEFSKVSIRTNQSITMMNPSNLRGLSYKCIKEYWRERWS